MMISRMSKIKTMGHSEHNCTPPAVESESEWRRPWRTSKQRRSWFAHAACCTGLRGRETFASSAAGACWWIFFHSISKAERQYLNSLGSTNTQSSNACWRMIKRMCCICCTVESNRPYWLELVALQLQYLLLISRQPPSYTSFLILFLNIKGDVYFSGSLPTLQLRWDANLQTSRFWVQLTVLSSHDCMVKGNVLQSLQWKFEFLSKVGLWFCLLIDEPSLIDHQVVIPLMSTLWILFASIDNVFHYLFGCNH